ncbi:MAG: hypothetical protein Q4C96_05110 [Planctomycetia bacterium]|nr:hypothetical protein [Planctomycetia bacterium]
MNEDADSAVNLCFLGQKGGIPVKKCRSVRQRKEEEDVNRKSDINSV